MKKGKVSSASGVIDDDDNTETMIRIKMEYLEQAKVEKEGGGGGEEDVRRDRS